MLCGKLGHLIRANADRIEHFHKVGSKLEAKWGLCNA
jgi:hypothetical protein